MLARRTPLKRTNSLKPTRWGIKYKKSRRVSKRAHLRPYLALVAQMNCAGELGITIPGRNEAWRDHMCLGPIQVAHLGVKPGLGLKCPDDEVGPLCMGLHQAFDQHRGEFKGWSRDERRAWADEVIRLTRLSAIPTTQDEAHDLEALGLGTVIKEVHGAGWAFLPVVGK